LTGNKVVVITTAALIGLQLLLTCAPFMNTLFSTLQLDARGWGLCLLVGLGVFALVEGEATGIGLSADARLDREHLERAAILTCAAA